MPGRDPVGGRLRKRRRRRGETLASYPILGNLREKSFSEIWGSLEAVEARRRISCKECHCTNEVFLWPSVVFQPLQLARTLAGAHAWRADEPLQEHERVAVSIGEDGFPERRT